jgi:hypothetical protein
VTGPVIGLATYLGWGSSEASFSPEHIRETQAWRSAAAAAYTKQFTRDT